MRVLSKDHFSLLGPTMNEKDSQFLHRQADLCTALSRATFDLTLAGRLRGMAEDLHRKASEWDDETDFSPHHFNGSRSHTGKSGLD
jgi:hypothetical protein